MDTRVKPAYDIVHLPQRQRHRRAPFSDSSKVSAQ
jgi:hypothetical protein